MSDRETILELHALLQSDPFLKEVAEYVSETELMMHRESTEAAVAVKARRVLDMIAEKQARGEK